MYNYYRKTVTLTRNILFSYGSVVDASISYEYVGLMQTLNLIRFLCTNLLPPIDSENGLLLTPSLDHLFDRGFIGFENNGQLIISPVAHRPSLQRMGIETDQTVNVGSFTQGQKEFLDFHRESVLLMVQNKSMAQ